MVARPPRRAPRPLTPDGRDYDLVTVGTGVTATVATRALQTLSRCGTMREPT
jgi:hypothetical protein